MKRPHLFEDFKAKRREATMIATTTNDVADHRIVKYLGIVRGITVRSRSVFGTIGRVRR